MKYWVQIGRGPEAGIVPRPAMNLRSLSVPSSFFTSILFLRQLNKSVRLFQPPDSATPGFLGRLKKNLS